MDHRQGAFGPQGFKLIYDYLSTHADGDRYAWAMVGFLLLAGVVVNNGIVFVDYVNQLRLEGRERTEALVQTGRDRIRPILMTALTSIFGLVTMALGLGSGGDMLQPLAIVTIGGLAYATLLTLFIVPAVYDIFLKKDPKKVVIEEVEE